MGMTNGPLPLPTRRVREATGTLTVVESLRDIPFELKRMFFITEVPETATRGGHAHLTAEEVLIVAKGGCLVTLDDGSTVRSVALDPDSDMIYVPRLTWITLERFEPGTVIVVAASEEYRPELYINEYSRFRSYFESGESSGSAVLMPSRAPVT